MTATVRRRVDAMIDAVGTVRALSVLRIALGPIVILHLEDFIADALDGVTYADRYYFAYADWYPEVGGTLYLVLLWTAVGAAVLMAAGVATRLTAGYTVAFVTWNLFLSKTHFAHNRAFLVILLTLVTVVPTGRYLSFDAWWRRRRRGPGPAPVPLWPLWLARFEVSAVYLASGISKVVDLDWWSGRVLQLRAIDNRELAIDQGAPAWAMDLLADGDVQWWLSKGAVLTEFVIGLGLWHPRTRLVAIWGALPFHVAIQITARVQVFSWAAIAALTLWVTPTDRDRTLLVTADDAGFAMLVRRLDWFGRFEIVDAADRTVLLDRTTERTGRDLRLTVLSRLPATFWFVAPLLLAHRLSGDGVTAFRPARPSAG